MATAKQVCHILDAVLRLPDGTAIHHADSLRNAGYLPSTQGRPEELDGNSIALIFISVLLGTPYADGNPELVCEYSAMRPPAGGPALGKVLGNFIAHPHDAFEFRIDMNAPGGSITHRRPDHGIAVTSYTSSIPHHRPAFGREAIVGAEVFVHLAAAIAAAPPVRAGRRRSLDRYQRFEYAAQH